jgi:hypothetical protein
MLTTFHRSILVRVTDGGNGNSRVAEWLSDTIGLIGKFVGKTRVVQGNVWIQAEGSNA